jgi:hypothetical protein
MFQKYSWKHKSSVSYTFIVIRLGYKVVFLNKTVLIDTDIDINGVVTKEKQFVFHNIACFLQGGFSVNSVTTPTTIFTAATRSDL